MKKIDKLALVDWDFSDAITNNNTHSFHPYPAKYIPQIPNVIIEALSNLNDTIYDPFLGSGTTCVEANILGRHAIGNDVNELAVLLSKVKTTPVNKDKTKKLTKLVDKIYLIVDEYYFNPREVPISKPSIINLDLWFEDFIIDEIVIIKEQILNLDDTDLIDFALIALSGIIVNISRQDSDTRYVRVKKNTKKMDAVKKFAKQLNKNILAMNNNYSELSKGDTIVEVADSRDNNIFPADSADLAITSPPYPNAYDYHLYHKYRLFWLDMVPYFLRKREIGSHADYSKKNGMTEFDFKNDMEKCFFNTSRILKNGSYFVLIIGDSILKGRNIKNNELLKDMSLNTPFSYVAEFSRNLNLNKKSFNPKIGNIKTEKIVIFQNNK